MVYCWYEGEIGPQINKQNVDAVIEIMVKSNHVVFPE